MFSTLPVELIEQIISYLDEDDKKTSAAICRVNRLLNEIGTPLLYKSVGIIDEDLGQDERSRRLQLLLRTLSQNLPLTQHVDEIAQNIDGSSIVHRPLEGGLEVTAIQDLVSRDLDLPFNLFDHLDASAEEISAESCVLILLAICPSAKTLRLRGDLRHLSWYGLPSIIYEIRDAEADDAAATTSIDSNVLRQGKTSFHTIEHLELEDRGFDDHMSFNDFEPLLGLPALRSIGLDSFHKSSEPPPESSYQDVRVEKIEIGGCFAKGEDLDELLTPCQNLKTLSIEWPSREDNYRRFDWADLGNSIRENCPELRHLYLEHPRDFMLDDDDFRNMIGDMNDPYLQNCHLPGLGSLRSLTLLESLHVSNIALLGTHRDDSFVPADFSDSDDEDDIKHVLASVTPDSLKELVVYCEHQGLHPADIAMLFEAGAERLENFTIMDCQKDEWVARKQGQLTASSQKFLAIVQAVEQST